MIARSTKAILDDFIESLIPKGAASISVHHFAKQLFCTPTHVSNLIKEGAIIVPESELELARTKKKPWTAVRIPRDSVIKFLRARTTLPGQARRKRKARK